MAKVKVWHVWAKNRRGNEIQLDLTTPVEIGKIVCDNKTRKNYKVVDYAYYELESKNRC